MAQITLTLDVDAAKGTATLKQFAGDAEAATKKAGDAAKEGGKGFGQFASSLDDTAVKLKDLLTPTNLLGAGIGVGLVAALDSAMNAAQAFGSEIRRLQLITDASTEELSAINVAQLQLGGSSETLQRAMFLMSREIEAGGDKLKQMGISIRESGGAMKNEVALLYEVSDALSGMTNRAQAAAKAREIFGRGAADLLPLLLAGRERIKELGLSAEELGVSLSAGASKALFEARIASNVFDTALLGVKNTITQDFLPAHELMLSALTQAAKLWIQMPGDVRFLIETVVTLTASVIALGVAFTALKAIMSAIGLTTLLSSVGSFMGLGGMVAALTASLAALGPELAALVLTATVSFLFDIGGIRTAAANLASTLTTWLIDQIRSIVGLPPIVLEIGPKGGGTWKEYWDTIWLGYQNLLEKLSGQPLTPALNYPANQSNIYKPRLGMPPIEVDNEKLVAELQARLHLDQQLAQAETELARATLPPLEAQLKAIQQQNAIKLESIAIEERKDKTEEGAAILAKVRAETIAAGLAMENKVKSDIYVRDITQLNTTAQLKAKAELAGEDLIRKEHDLAVDLAEKTLANRLKMGLSAVEANRVANKAIEDADSKQTLSLIELDAKRATAQAALHVQTIEATLATQKQIETIGIAGVEADRKALDLKLKNFQISEDQYVTAAQDLEGKLLAMKLAAIQKEEDADRAKAAEALEALKKQRLDAVDLAAEKEKIEKTLTAQLLALQGKRIEAGIAFGKQMTDLEVQRAAKSVQIETEAAHNELAIQLKVLDQLAVKYADNAAALQVIDAQRLDAIQKDRDAEIAIYAKAELLKTGLLQDATLRRIAMEAKAITDIQAARQKVIDDSAIVLEQQARREGDLWTALEAGFAHAVSSAQDALKAMDAAGIKLFDDLKSGTSDFLYEILSTSGKIGDAFTNLGKRILRTMTDTFAEILVKWAMTAAGFTLPGLLGTGTAAASTIGAVDAATKAAALTELASLGETAAGATNALAGVAQGGSMVTTAFSAITQTIGLFASGIVAVLQFIGSIASGNAASGLASLFGSGSGSLLGQLSSGLSSIFSAIGGGFNQIVQGIAGMLPNAGTLGPAFGGAAGMFQSGMSFIAQAAPWIGAAYGLYQMFSGQLSPLSGALQGATIGAMFGGPIGAGIGAIVGTIAGFISSFFSSTPQSKLVAQVAPFDLNQMLTQPAPTSTGERILMPYPSPQHHGSHAGSVFVNVGGDIFESDAQKFEYERQVANALAVVLQQTLKAFSRLGTALPPVISTQLDTAMKALAEHGLGTVFSQIVDDEEGKRLQEGIKVLPGHLIQSIVDALGMHIDLTALGAGDAIKGFDGLMAAMSAMGAILKVVAKDTDLSSITLDEFATNSVKYFQQFAKDGETFIDTVKRISAALSGIIDLQGQVASRLQALTGDVVGAITAQGQALMSMIDNIVGLADALQVAVESMASPEDVLKAAQALLQAYDAAIQMIQQLKAELDALNTAITSSVDLAVQLTQKIDALRGTSIDPTFLQDSINGIVYLFNSITDVTARIALFASGLVLLSESTGGVLANIPLVVAGFNLIMESIQQMTNPQQAIAALKDLASAVEAGLQAGIAAINRQTQERITALNTEKSAIQSAFDARKKALDAELTAAQQWGNIVSSVKTQLTDIFTLLAPTHPLTSLNDVRAQFQAAFAAFQGAPTAEGAAQVQELARQLLQLAQQTPGFDLPSQAFQSLAAEVQTALQAIQTFAVSQPTQAQVQAKIAALADEQAASLADIDAKIAAATAAGQEQIQQLQALAAKGLEAIRTQLIIEITALAAQQAQAAAALQAVLGDKTFEQFIADKQAEAATLLKGIQDILTHYLGGIAEAIGAKIPALATGGLVTRPTLALVGESGPEAIIPLSQNGMPTRTGDTSVTFYIHVTASGDVNAKKLVDDLEPEILERFKYGRLRAAVQDTRR